MNTWVYFLVSGSALGLIIARKYYARKWVEETFAGRVHIVYVASVITAICFGGTIGLGNFVFDWPPDGSLLHYVVLSFAAGAAAHGVNVAVREPYRSYIANTEPPERTKK